MNNYTTIKKRYIILIIKLVKIKKELVVIWKKLAQIKLKLVKK